ncbi:MAG TPA: hypothetical protein VHZ04_00580 [Candidatus Paceibacterota bacterium]|jgi:hypothetical protein|nr:hypothetical protein [Candidatus Paceibacterota bacterium]
MKNFLQSSKGKAILIIIGGVIVVLAVFAFGASVGYHRGLFADHFGENYFKNFYGGPAGKMTMTMHGVAGDVIGVSSATIAVEAADGDEQSVFVPAGVVIREEDNTIMVQDVNVGDGITVIGDPTEEGQIEARFIRVFPASSSMMQMVMPAMPVPVQIIVPPGQGQP